MCFHFYIVLLCQCGKFFAWLRRMHGYSCGFSDKINHVCTTPWLCKIYRFAVDRDSARTCCINCRLCDESFGEIHDVGVVGEGLVELHHGELRVVSCRDSFITEDATNLIHTLHAAHNEALEVQLQCDAQEQLHVERIVMCHKWTRMCTASLHV
ncbi:unannotated protein [freshwater metagenome]|uniref:Unannotated protein n=1 Tax=freshwater metagenome TaxID=449393 RepID=A0A6J6L151_9ZZZZ